MKRPMETEIKYIYVCDSYEKRFEYDVSVEFFIRNEFC